MWIFYLLGIIIALVIDYAVSKQFEEIAEMKGHDGRTYFWFVFILGLVGMLMVVALPVQTSEEKYKTDLLYAKETWKKAQENAANKLSTKDGTA